jgi:hypothetical protein
MVRFRDDARCGSDPAISGSGRAAASDAAHRQAAESAQADFAFFQRRIMPFASLIQKSPVADAQVPGRAPRWLEHRGRQSAKADFV